MDSRKIVIAFVLISLAFLSYEMTGGILSVSERKALIVLILAAGLWTTEAIPLVATSLAVPLLQTLLEIQELKPALSPFFDPVVMLLLGGFLLAIAVEKHDLDEYFANQIISRVGTNARLVVLVFMLTTVFLSMWISNTAATALMLTMALRFTDRIRDELGNFAKIMVLSIAYSATVGGLATLVGTTTCAMAAGFLRDLIGHEITFLGWMYYGLPITLIMTTVIWLVLFYVFPTDVKRIPEFELERDTLELRQRGTLMVFVLAIVMWLTGKLPEPLAIALGWTGHGMSSSLVAGIIAVLLLVSGLIRERDIANANWNTLLLIGAGMSLGSVMEVSGLMVRISEGLLSLTGRSSALVTITIVTFFGLGISIIASNTASAGIFLPIAIGLGGTTSVSPVVLAIVVGISTSLDFMLPVGTPPNAIAYSTGRVSMGDMMKAGVLLDLMGALITIMLALFLWS